MRSRRLGTYRRTISLSQRNSFCKKGDDLHQGARDMIVYNGFQNGKFQVSETESGVKLDFRGRDGDRFEQLNGPDSNSVKQVAKVEWTVNAFCEQMVHNLPDQVKALLHN